MGIGTAKAATSIQSEFMTWFFEIMATSASEKTRDKTATKMTAIEAKADSVPMLSFQWFPVNHH
jgi:hypothetical protein